MSARIHRSPAGPGRRGRLARRGYTLVEVMLAIGVMAVGATAILGLQQAAIRGNQEANEYAVATRTAEMWLDRFRLDALSWNQGGAGATAGPGTFAATQFMRMMPPTGATPWFEPVPATAGSYLPATRLAFQGNPSPPAGSPGPVYCTQAQLSWVYPATAIRVDVRVFWMRRGPGAAAVINCANPPDPTGVTHRVVAASTVIRWTPR
jgi:type IV pilus assembly protein PilV